MSGLLQKIDSPADLKALTPDALPAVAEEIRKLIIETVSRNGGHLAANLGTVELTLALLRVFEPPADKLLWDVSHQTYAYKILTGRRDAFHTLRQTGGISGFLLREESPYDAFGAGHAGTALSAALGMAVARDAQNGGEHVVAVVGDGALGCGVSLEALNHIAGATRRFIVVLNDNEMSISANVGSVARYLSSLLAQPRYNRWKTAVERFARMRLGLGWLRNVYFRLEEAVKSLFLDSVIFEEFGLRYIGPVDGHDLKKLIGALEIARNSDEPILIHVATRKGLGYGPAEEDPEEWHGTGAFESATGRVLSPAVRLRYSGVFGGTMERLAEKESRLVAITAAMMAGTGLTGFASKFPSRFYDVGISEEHAVVFAAGLACRGFLPVVAIYSTFSQRIVDYVIHDVCLQKLPVIFCLDRGGIVGDDGPTHHGVFDIALFRSVPNLVFMQPKDEAELARMLDSAVRWNRPVMIRYPRGAGPGTPVPDVLEEIPFGKAEVVRTGADVQCWALGDMQRLAGKVADRLAQRGVNAGVVNPRFITPLDRELLLESSRSARMIVTLENAVVSGGFGSAVGDALMENGYGGRLLRFGWPVQFIPHGSADALADRFGMTETAISDAILRAMSAASPPPG
ncbi:MAG: 1-deoxy-D-xylulose-5-phosphate synthase [Lentisphaerae bacterium]|nr:1-deoxy-D-xylulose-5-phosphate synthase [Lentisphaerota bacterium]